VARTGLSRHRPSEDRLDGAAEVTPTAGALTNGRWQPDEAS